MNLYISAMLFIIANNTNNSNFCRLVVGKQNSVYSNNQILFANKKN